MPPLDLNSPTPTGPGMQQGAAYAFGHAGLPGSPWPPGTQQQLMQGGGDGGHPPQWVMVHDGMGHVHAAASMPPGMAAAAAASAALVYGTGPYAAPQHACMLLQGTLQPPATGTAFPSSEVQGCTGCWGNPPWYAVVADTPLAMSPVVHAQTAALVAPGYAYRHASTPGIIGMPHHHQQQQQQQLLLQLLAATGRYAPLPEPYAHLLARPISSAPDTASASWSSAQRLMRRSRGLSGSGRAALPPSVLGASSTACGGGGGAPAVGGKQGLLLGAAAGQHPRQPFPPSAMAKSADIWMPSPEPRRSDPGLGHALSCAIPTDRSTAAAATDDDGPGWAQLTTSVLLQVLRQLVAHGSRTAALRGVCRHWRAVVDDHMTCLRPASLHPKLLAARFPSLTALHLTACSNVRNRDLQLLAGSGLALCTLMLGDDANRPWVSNQGLAWIARVSSITALGLHDCTQLTNRGLGALAGLPRLAALSLKGCNKLNNTGMEGLRHNTALTALNVAGCMRVSDKGLAALTCLPLLASLHLGGTRVRDEGMGYVAQLSGLTSLHVAGEMVSDAGLSRLTALRGLKTLALRDCTQFSGAALGGLLSALPALTSLDVGGSRGLDDTALAGCITCAPLGLTALDLSGCAATWQQSLGALTRLTGLRSLVLAARHHHDGRFEQGLGALRALTQITSLAVHNCRLVSRELGVALGSLTELRALDVSLRPCDLALAREPLGERALAVLASAPQLTSLDVSRRLACEEELAVLAARLPRLTSLQVTGCPLLFGSLHGLQRRFPRLAVYRRAPADSQLACTDFGEGLGRPDE